MEPQQFYWAPHSVHIWAPAQQTRKNEQQIEVLTEENKTYKLPITEAIMVQTNCLQGMPDLLHLGDLNECTSLHNVRSRYYQDQIYTSVGMPILISLNPYKKLPIYSMEKITYYKNMRKEDLNSSEKCEPHLFHIAEMTFQNLFEQKVNQAIIISGESGSGKTEATKYILKYLATEIIQSKTGTQKQGGMLSQPNKDSLILKPSMLNGPSVEDQILDSNPLLQAFGNAKTVQNDNSSRFGQFIRVFFTQSRKIHSARIVNYLLQKSRVVKNSSEERNYHIFYQVFTNDPSWRAQYYLKTIKDYNYTKNSDLKHNGDDEANFQLTLNCMNVLGLSDAEKDDVFRIVSAVLNLGNIEFRNLENDKSEVQPECLIFLSNAATLIGIKKQALIDLLVSKNIWNVEKKENIKTVLNADNAVFMRDSISKVLYSKLFDWLIEKVNQTLEKPHNSQRDGKISEIGILDIFGFEIFKENSFEQLCINYANQRLQQQFNNHMFKMEQEEYIREQIEWEHIQFQDNQQTLDLFDKIIFQLTDEQSKLKNGTDEQIIDQIQQTVSSNSFFLPNNNTQGGDQCFGVKHFAGDVVYDVTNFMQQNQDSSNQDFVKILSESNNQIIAEEFGDELKEIANKSQTRTNQNTISGQFRVQLNQLIAQLNSSQPFYIRCIKPNNNQKASELDSGQVLRQLRCAGLLEAIRIRKAGYAIRRGHEEFLRRYRVICPSVRIIQPFKVASQQFVLKVSNLPTFKELMHPQLQNFQIGENTFFMKENLKAVFDAQLHTFMRQFVLKIQKVFRGYVDRKYCRRFKYAKAILKKNVSAYRLRRTIRQRIQYREKKRLQQEMAKKQRQEDEKQKRILEEENKMKKMSQQDASKTTNNSTGSSSSNNLTLSAGTYSNIKSNVTPETTPQEEKPNYFNSMKHQLPDSSGNDENENLNPNDYISSLLKGVDSSFHKKQGQSVQIGKLQELEIKLKKEHEQKLRIEEQMMAMKMRPSCDADILIAIKNKLRENYQGNFIDSLMSSKTIEQMLDNLAKSDSEIETMNMKLEASKKNFERYKKEAQVKLKRDEQLRQLLQENIKRIHEEKLQYQQDLAETQSLNNSLSFELEKSKSDLKVQNEVISKLKENDTSKDIDYQIENKKLKQIQKQYIAEAEKHEEQLNEKIQKVSQLERDNLAMQKELYELKNKNYEQLNQITLRTDDLQIVQRENEKLRAEIKILMEERQSSRQDAMKLSQVNDASIASSQIPPETVKKEDYDKLKVYRNHLSRESQASKQILQTLINLLQWKNLEVDQLKKNLPNELLKSQESVLYQDLTGLKSKENVLMQKLQQQMKQLEELEAQKQKLQQKN